MYTVVGGCFLRRDINQMVPQWPLRLCGYLVQSRASVGNQNLDWRTMVHISLWCLLFYSFDSHGFTNIVVVSFEHFLLYGSVVLLVVVLLLLLLLLLLPTGRFPLDLAKVLVGILKEHCCWRPWRVVLTCGRLVSLLGLCFFNVSFVSSDSLSSDSSLFPFKIIVCSCCNCISVSPYTTGHFWGVGGFEVGRGAHLG